MLKLLFWAIVLYFIYQWVQRKLALPQNDQRFFSEPRRPEKDAADEGEYIDYEEIK